MTAIGSVTAPNSFVESSCVAGVARLGICRGRRVASNPVSSYVSRIAASSNLSPTFLRPLGRKISPVLLDRIRSTFARLGSRVTVPQLIAKASEKCKDLPEESAMIALGLSRVGRV